jgi:hypothetical protein
MDAENWKAIVAAQVVQLDDADRWLLDQVQSKLGLNDRDFRHFLVLIGKIAPSAARLNAVHLPNRMIEVGVGEWSAGK